MKTKRTSVVKMTTEARVLRHMRRSRNLSMRDAGRLCKPKKLASSTINHLEKGRLDLTPERIADLLRIYGFTYGHLEEYLHGKEIVPTSIKEECLSLLGQISEKKTAGGPQRIARVSQLRRLT